MKDFRKLEGNENKNILKQEHSNVNLHATIIYYWTKYFQVHHHSIKVNFFLVKIKVLRNVVI
jgi:hypothetical protein